MINLILMSALICAPTIFINKTNIKDTTHAFKTYKFNYKNKRCEAHFKKHPCIKEFIITGPQSYLIICGDYK